MIAAKTILQVKKSLNMFGVLMICGQDKSAGEKNLWIFPGCWWSSSQRTLQAKKCWNISRLLMIAAKTILQVKKSLNMFGVLMICGQDNSAGEKSFEFFQVVDDLQLRQFCRWKNLWIFSEFGWSAAKKNLQAKKTLINFGILMIRGQDNFAGEKVWIFSVIDDLRPSNFAGEKDFEYFQVVDDFRPRQFCRQNNLWIFSVIDDLRPRQLCRRKRLWIFPGYWWFAAKTILQV